MAATMVMGLWRLAMSFWMRKTGQEPIPLRPGQGPFLQFASLFLHTFGVDVKRGLRGVEMTQLP